MLAVAIFSYSHSINAPFAFVTKISLSSLLYWLLLTSFAVLRFSQPMDEGAFFRAVIRVLAFIAICGLGAFVAQFVGLTLFSVQHFLADRNSPSSPPITSSFRSATRACSRPMAFSSSNRPIFSQFMALGLACEWVTQRRPWLVALFLFALFSAVSGTGWLAVGGFVAYIGLTSGSRGIATAIGFSLVCALAFVAIGFFLPDVAEIVDRAAWMNSECKDRAATGGCDPYPGHEPHLRSGARTPFLPAPGQGRPNSFYVHFLPLRAEHARQNPA